MKSMTCKQLGGACEERFYAATFEEIAQMSKYHGIEMYKKGDKDHITAMEDMKKLMTDPQALQKWMQEKKEAFNAMADQ